MKKPVIFCDFDGTVTNQDNIINIMKKFGPPGWEGVKDSILSQEISIQEGVGQMFRMLPSALKDEVIAYVLSEARIREGFADFVDYTRHHGIKLYIVSGGIEFFVKPLLEKYGPFDGIYCNESDFSRDQIEIIFPHSCDDLCTNQGCGCCKPSIIRRLHDPETMSIVIGDSITDLEAAKLADVVIARDYLIDKCNELGISYHGFESFHDVTSIIESRLGVNV